MWKVRVVWGKDKWMVQEFQTEDFDAVIGLLENLEGEIYLISIWKD